MVINTNSHADYPKMNFNQYNLPARDANEAFARGDLDKALALYKAAQLYAKRYSVLTSSALRICCLLVFITMKMLQ